MIKCKRKIKHNLQLNNCATNKKRYFKGRKYINGTLILAIEYVSFILFSLSIAIPLVSMINTNINTSSQPILLKTSGDWIWMGCIILTTLIAITCLKKAKENQNKLTSAMIISLASAVIIANITLLIVSSLIGTDKSYSADVIKKVLTLINISYFITALGAIVMIILTLVLNYKNGWLNRNNWIAFISIAPGAGLLAVLYRHYITWNEFVTSRNFSNYKFAHMMNDFVHAGVPMSLGQANDPAYILTYFGPLLTYLLLLIGGIAFVQKAKRKHKQKA